MVLTPFTMSGTPLEQRPTVLVLHVPVVGQSAAPM
jgi:hypothetical protein